MRKSKKGERKEGGGTAGHFLTCVQFFTDLRRRCTGKNRGEGRVRSSRGQGWGEGGRERKPVGAFTCGKKLGPY